MEKKPPRFANWIAAPVVAALMLTGMLPITVGAAELPVAAAALQPDRIHVAQNEQRPKRRTLMDLLFGDEDEQKRVPAVETPVVRTPRASLPPAEPAVEKAIGATRLAVFGDSMAVDVGNALERFYAEDPNIVILEQGVGSSGFVRPDFFDWTKAIAEEIAANSFDIAVVIIGVNDRQAMDTDTGSHKALTPEWTAAYSARVAAFVAQLRNAGKPTIWIGLPPMEAPTYATAINQISEIQKLAAFSGGAEFLDIYERFVDEDGKYSAQGPDLNGNRVRMRKEDGIHFSAAGADKLAFYLNQTLKLYYRGGSSVGLDVADALLGTDAQLMVRPPFQGLGQIRLLEVAGAVIPLSHTSRRAVDLVSATSADAEGAGFDMEQLIEAPVGRVDAFGVGKLPEARNRSGR